MIKRNTKKREPRFQPSDRFNDAYKPEKREKLTMYGAVCDQCGKDCKVPFQPSPEKPVYCSDCYERVNGGDPDRRSSSRELPNGKYSAICSDCGKPCEVPFRPNGETPIYCSQCFERRGNSHENDSVGGSKKNFSSSDPSMSEISMKLDKIIRLLERR